MLQGQLSGSWHEFQILLAGVAVQCVPLGGTVHTGVCRHLNKM